MNGGKKAVFPGLPWSVLVALAYVGMAILHTLPMILHLATKTPIALNSLPSMYIIAEQCRLFLVEHPFDLMAAFSPTVMAPMDSPFFLSNTSIVMSVLIAPVYLPTGNLHLASNYLVLLNLAGSAFSVFLLARYWLSNDRAAFLAGTVFSFTAGGLYFLVDIVFIGFIFPPLIILFFERFAEGGERRDLVILPILLVAEFYTNLYHLALTFLLLGVLTAVRFRLVFRRRNALPLCLAAAACLAATLPVAIPYAQAVLRYEFPGAYMANLMSRLSVAPAEWVNVSPNNFLYGAFAQRYTQDHLEFLGALFPGLVALGLGLAGLARKDRLRVSPWVLFALTAFAAAAATGWSPFAFFKQKESYAVVLQALGEVIPFFKVFRTPYRFIVLGGLTGAMLVGAGYLRLEQAFVSRLARKGGGSRPGWLAFASPLVLVVGLVNLENLSIPTDLRGFKDAFEPSAGDRWLARNRIPARDDEYILHLPSVHFNYHQWDPRFLKELYEESYAPLYRHLAYRHPIVEGRLSILPVGWLTDVMRGMPSRPAFAELRAMGVGIVVAHDRLLHGSMRKLFDDRALKGAGLRPLASFPDGDRVYAISCEVPMADRLLLAAAVVDNRVRVDFRTPLVERMPAGERRVKRDSGTPDGEVRCAPGERFSYFLNPKKCARQHLELKIEDGRGEVHAKRAEYILPLVLHGTTRKAAVLWDPAAEGLEAPYELLSVSVEEPYVRRFEDARPTWRLERE